MNQIFIPESIHTERLILKRWRKDDASDLMLLLELNVNHLQRWIPPRISEPVPLKDLKRRIEGFIMDFNNGKEWRYGIFKKDNSELIGEAALFPRDTEKRVPAESANRIEIGYWITENHTGKGFASEVTKAFLEKVINIIGVEKVEIHCDERNHASAAIPKKLGFQLAEKKPDGDPYEMMWIKEV